MKSTKNRLSSVATVVLAVMMMLMSAAVPGFAASFDNATALKDGKYAPENFAFEGGTGRVTISCIEVIANDGKAEATIQFTSRSITQVTVADDETVYVPEIDQEAKTATVTIPVRLNEAVVVHATTTAMSKTTVVDYTITVTLSDAASPKNEINSGEKLELSAGTYEAVDPAAITARNKMFKCEKAELIVKEDKSAVLDIYLSGTGYDSMYVGKKLETMPNGAITKTNENGLWTSEELPVTAGAVAVEGTLDRETKLHYRIPLAELYTWVLSAGHSAKYDQWSHKILDISADNFKLKDKESAMAAFSDLDQDAWYKDGITYALENKLMNGIGENRFDPNGATSRAMMVTLLWRLAGEPIVEYNMSFADVKSGSWYEEAVRWAAYNKIVGGYSAEAFGPEDNISRQQLATMLYNYAKFAGRDVSAASGDAFAAFADASEVASWAEDGMNWAVSKELVKGIGNTLCPDDDASRAETATILMRFK